MPATIQKDEESLGLKPSVGGLATGMRTFYQSYDCAWVGWPGLPSEELVGREDEVAALLAQESLIPVHLPGDLLDGFYYGYANRTLWPLFHYFQHLAEFDRDLWRAYRAANERFADALVDLAEPGDTIWVHDYQLLLVPGLLREQLPDCPIGFFLHIPFPSSEVFRILPEREAILDGLLGADLIGFHSYEYARHFLSSVVRLRGREVELNRIRVGNRTARVDVFPMGIDYDKFSTSTLDDAISDSIRQARRDLGDRRMILSVDRLDYTKGILERLEAFELFLSRYPHLADQVLLVLLVVPSRTSVPEYETLKREIDELVGRINGEFGGVGRAPISYLYRSLDFPDLHALYEMADVGLVTPVRDGMNLVAKEYVASKRDGDGVLILGEMAGASMELCEGLIVNPNNSEQVAAALAEALEMPLHDRQERMWTMQERIRRYDVTRWARDFRETLESAWTEQRETPVIRLDPMDPDPLIEAYRSADSRLLFLEYHGTLVEFARRPRRVVPDTELRRVICELNETDGNTVVVISNRRKDQLEQLIGDSAENLIAEDGVWLREADGEWHMLAPLDSGWKDEIRPILEFFADRTPGSVVEERDYSLVFHYRRTEPDLGVIRSREILELLLMSTAQMDLDVREGPKSIEVRNKGVNKGRAALRWLDKDRWDFIMMAGNDTADESIFTSLPERTYSVRVGGGPTAARFRIGSVGDMRKLLWRLAEEDGPSGC